MGIQFTALDFNSPESTERTMRRFEHEIASSIQQTAKTAAVNPAELAAQLAPAMREELQANGSAPLNLQSLLLPGQSLSTALEDTHANRLTNYSSGTQPAGAEFFETDRMVLYVNNPSLAWQYAGGVYAAAFASRPADLGTTDAGFLFFATDQLNAYIWDGAAWSTISNRWLVGGFFGIVTHANTADRTYTFQDTPGKVVLAVDTRALTGQTAAIGSTNFSNASAAGTYRLNYYLEDTTADLAAGTIQLSVTFTDAAGAATVTSAALALTALGRTSGVFFIQLSSGAIAYSTILTGIIGTSVYALYMSLERLS